MKKIGLAFAFLVLLVLSITFSSAHAVPMGPHDITFVSHVYDGTYSTWSYDVTSVPPPSISNGIITWCIPDAIVEVYADGVLLPESPGGPPCWEYCPPEDPDPNTGLYGVKIEDGGVWDEDDPDTVRIVFVLQGDYVEGQIDAGIKAGLDTDTGKVTGPTHQPANGVPEFPFASVVVTSFGLIGALLVRRRQKKFN